MLNQKNLNVLFKSNLIGSFFAIISIFIFSIIIFFTNTSITIQNYGLYTILILSLLIISLNSGKNMTVKGFLSGLFSGLLFLFILLLLNLIINFEDFNLIKYILKMPFLLLISMIGGIIGKNLKK